jgi:ribokinase
MGGETINGIDFNQFCGGKGANQAIAIGRLGGSVTMLGKVGSDSYGKLLLNAINENNVINKIKVVENVSTGVATILVEKDGENRIIIVHGANYQVETKDLTDNLDLIMNTSIIVTQLELKMDVVDKLAILAKENNKLFILNPAPFTTISDKTLSCTTYLTPNETELALLCSKKSFENLAEVKQACLMLLKKGVKNVIVTLGKQGALIVNDTMMELVNGYKVKAVDTTAAGDCFNGALAYCLDENIPLIDAVKFANMAAALSVTKKGAIPSLPFINDVKKFQEELLKKV